MDSKAVADADKQVLRTLIWREGSEIELKSALITLMRMLCTHYGRQIILLIDEYDVPLDKANNNGYYDQMVTFLRGFFGEAFKTNPNLFFAVVTGCLHISKESIFTGINNLKMDTITDKRYDEYFGFTDGDVRKKIVETLTCGELMESIDNLWSVLFLTGYLTVDRNAPKLDDGFTSLVIPNREIREIFIEKIQKWFRENKVAGNQNGLYEAIWSCDCERLQEQLRNILLDTISYYDYYENYYHALLVDLLLNSTYSVHSNAEMGAGRSDIVVEDDRNRRAVIIEVKRSRKYEDMEADCEKGIRQIQEKNYAWPYLRRKYRVLAYGIAFADKDCCVKSEENPGR